ncbi:MAG TPA: YeeE/YedE thiosulfate transporter family protein [Anaeromyxobacteraceae bacterium]
MIFPIQAIADHRELSMLAGVLVGFGFGFVLERAGFGNALKLAAQFYGTEMVMLKVMFTAIVTAVLVTVLVSGVGMLDLRALADSVASATFLWPMIAGGFVIGVGIILSGYCPGTSVVGIASGKLDAVFAFFGVMLGQLAWTEIEFRAPIARFHNSGEMGHLYLYDLFKVPPAVVATGIVLLALVAFIAGEKIERLVTGAPAPTGPSPRRYVFAGIGAFGLVALLTLALPAATVASTREPSMMRELDLARRVLDEPWKVRVVDLRPMADCGARRVPGSECVPADQLAKIGLADANGARDLILVAAGDLPEIPAQAAGYPGRIFALKGGFPAWEAFALRAPEPPAPGAAPAEYESYRLRAGVAAAMTGVKAAPPPPMPAGDAGPKKKGGGGGGCGG